jgi:hypothetical protein
VEIWHAAARGERVAWRALFEGYGAAVDWPAASFWEEIAAAYPDAPILLSLRDAESWWKSASTTIFPAKDHAPDPAWRAMFEELCARRFTPDLTNRAACIAAYERHVAHVRATGPWGLRLSRASGATFHAVTAGACWVRVPGRAPRELRSGDIVLLPTGAGHVIASHATGPARAWDRVAKAQARNTAGEIVLAGSGTPTHLICAAYDYDREVAHPLLSLLPATLFVSGDESVGARRTLRLLHRELTAPSAGSVDTAQCTSIRPCGPRWEVDAEVSPAPGRGSTTAASVIGRTSCGSRLAPDARTAECRRRSAASPCRSPWPARS